MVIFGIFVSLVTFCTNLKKKKAEYHSSNKNNGYIS